MFTVTTMTMRTAKLVTPAVTTAAASIAAIDMLVLREIMAAQTIPVTPEELEAEAAAIARRQNTTVAELKRFLGEDLAMLQSDLKKRKAAAWACEQMAAAK